MPAEDALEPLQAGVHRPKRLCNMAGASWTPAWLGRVGSRIASLDRTENNGHGQRYSQFAGRQIVHIIAQFSATLTVFVNVLDASKQSVRRACDARRIHPPQADGACLALRLRSYMAVNDVERSTPRSVRLLANSGDDDQRSNDDERCDRSLPPPITFSEWVPWHDRARLKRAGRRWLGVYLWGHFRQEPPSGTRPYPNWPEELIYAGETKDLDARPLGSRRHHRISHYLDTYGEDTELKFLHVSVFRVACFSQTEDEGYVRLRAFTRYLEARIFWEYAQRWGHRAALDYKKGTDKE